MCSSDLAMRSIAVCMFARRQGGSTRFARAGPVCTYASAVADRLEELCEALERQARACEALGSWQYAQLIEDLIVDVRASGITWALLSARPEDPLRDALVLRYLGAVHRIVLRGDATGLAAFYPSAGGRALPIPTDLFLETVVAHRDEVEDGLAATVQTNEVGRCAALVPAFAAACRRFRLPLNMVEVGASGGLLSNWDHYWYDCFGQTAGEESSAVRFTNRWTDPFTLDGL